MSQTIINILIILIIILIVFLTIRFVLQMVFLKECPHCGKTVSLAVKRECPKCGYVFLKNRHAKLNLTIVLLIMAIGNILGSGFDRPYALQNNLVMDRADVIATYVYRQGIENHNYGYASAVGLFYSAVGFLFVVTSNRLSRRATGSSLW